jgi:hypothetical protein
MPNGLGHWSDQGPCSCAAARLLRLPATGIQVTVNVPVNVPVNGVTGTAATATANLVVIQPAPGGCHVAYTSIGFQGTWMANNTSPASFRLNGAACT